MRATATDWGLLVLRLGFSTLMLWLHGWPRVEGVYAHFVDGAPWGFVGIVERLGLPYPLVFAVLSSFAESVATLLVGLGLWTRVGASLVAINMGVALWAAVSGGDAFELPALYLAVALALTLAGGGRLAVTPSGNRRR